MEKIKIIGICGSLRQESYNNAALLAIKNLAPNNIELEIVSLSEIPFFNEDIENEGVPLSVVNLKEKINNSDAVIIATPEYNYSIPGVLKNTLDWLSRGDLKPLKGKPTAIISASLGMLGGARVQYHLRQVCLALDMNVVSKPEVFIGKANTKFNNNRLIDEYTQKILIELIEQLVVKTNK
jgi:chromate reductase